MHRELLETLFTGIDYEKQQTLTQFFQLLTGT